MSVAPFRVVSLDATQDRTLFKGGSGPLVRYFQQQVTQDIRRRVAACFIALTNEQHISGFYTLAAASLLLSDLPAAVAKKIPRYPSVPAVRMGRLALDQEFKGLGLECALLADALVRAARSEIAAFAMMVDATDDAAVAFYRHNGFIALPESAKTLFLPLSLVR